MPARPVAPDKVLIDRRVGNTIPFVESFTPLVSFEDWVDILGPWSGMCCTGRIEDGCWFRYHQTLSLFYF